MHDTEGLREVSVVEGALELDLEHNTHSGNIWIDAIWVMGGWTGGRYTNGYVAG